MKGGKLHMEVMEVVFKRTSNASVILYSALSQVAPIVGVLKSSMCGGRFYCDVTTSDDQGRPAGTGGYYKLIDPSRYNINADTAFVRVKGNNVIASTRMIDSSMMFQTGYNVASKPTALYMQAYNEIMDIKNRNNPDSVERDITKGYYNDYSSNHLSMLRDIDVNYNRPASMTDYNKLRINTLSAFDRFRNASLVDSKLHKAFPRVFFTRPDLNLFDSASPSPNARYSLPQELTSSVRSDSWFYQTYKTDPHLIASLTTQYTGIHAFNPFLSNYASSFDVSDDRLETLEHGETFTGWKVKYAKHNIASKTAGSFSIAYDETNKIEVYKIHKAWVDYMAKVYRGEFKPKHKYITEKRLDYACSVYYFVCGEDGETVLFWSKYIGVFPTNVPSSQFSWSKNDIIKHPENSIEYEYTWKEDCEYASLADFNYNSGLSPTLQPAVRPLSIYDVDKCGVGPAFAMRPFITLENNASGVPVVKLKYSELVTI